jgi:hypothetical protein
MGRVGLPSASVPSCASPATPRATQPPLSPVAGHIVTDVQLAALALEHGLTVYSADSDFARFDEIRWESPVAP